MSNRDISQLVSKTAEFLRSNTEEIPDDDFVEAMQMLDATLKRMSNTCTSLECRISAAPVAQPAAERKKSA
jgi:hypothetical protein